MGTASDLAKYLPQLRAALTVRGVYDAEWPAGQMLRTARDFMERGFTPAEAAAWWAAGVGPSAAGPLAAQDITPEQWTAYLAQFVAEARQANSPELGLEWMVAGRRVEVAVAWANLGYEPQRAAPLIAAGITAETAGEIEAP